MQFSYHPDVQEAFPTRVSGIIGLCGIHDRAEVTARTRPLLAQAANRIAAVSEGALPEIRAWRAAFATMGLKPTQYRCASEALLRRFRKDGGLPTIHPLVDLCNATSIAYAIPIAVFDPDRIDGDLTVREAMGSERYESFGGDVETPSPGEIIFADSAQNAHARRWTNRQSRLSAVSSSTRTAVIVAEALHEGAIDDIERLTAGLCADLHAAFSADPARAVLSHPSSTFEFASKRG